MIRQITLAGTVAALVACGSSPPVSNAFEKPKGPPPSVFDASDWESKMPADIDVVFGINVPRLWGAPIVQSMLDRVPGDSAEMIAAAEKQAKECGIAFPTDMHQLVVGIHSADPEAMSLLMTGSFTSDVMLGCMLKLAKERGEAVSEVEVAGHKALSFDGEAYAAVPRANTLVLSPSRPRFESLLDEKTARLTSNADLTALVGKLSQERAFYGAGLFPTDSGATTTMMSAGLTAPPVSAYGTIDVGEGIDLAITIALASNEDAKTLLAYLDKQIGSARVLLTVQGLGFLLENTEIAAKGALCTVELSLNGEEVNKLIDMAATLMDSFM